MLILFVIQCIFTIVLVYLASIKFYEDEELTIKCTSEVYYYLLFIFISLIPFIGFIMIGLFIYSTINELNNEEIFYKKGWFTKLLTKKI